jgi:hypothetical protein
MRRSRCMAKRDLAPQLVEGRQSLQFPERLLAGADDTDAGMPRKDRFVFRHELERLLGITPRDVGLAQPLRDTRLDQQDAELLDRKQTAESGRDEIAEEVDRLLVAVLPARVDDQLGEGESSS